MPRWTLITAATRQVARRQLTWLRSWRNDSRHTAVVDHDPAETLERLFIEAKGQLTLTLVQIGDFLQTFETTMMFRSLLSH